MENQHPLLPLRLLLFLLTRLDRKSPHFTMVGPAQPGWQLAWIPLSPRCQEQHWQLSTGCRLSYWQLIPEVLCRESEAAQCGGFTYTRSILIQPNAKLQIQESSVGHATEKVNCTLESRGCERD